MNTYTIRYQLGGDEHTDELQADNAATAARIIEERHLHEEERFELLEVHMVEDEENEKQRSVQEQSA